MRAGSATWACRTSRPGCWSRRTNTRRCSAARSKYHPFLGQDRLLEIARGRDLPVTAYSPLPHGRVPGDATLAETSGPTGTPDPLTVGAGSRMGSAPGAVAEWLRSGLQSRLHRFDSGRRLRRFVRVLARDVTIASEHGATRSLGGPKPALIRRRALSAWSRTWSAPRRRETSGSPPGSGSPSCPGP